MSIAFRNQRTFKMKKKTMDKEKRKGIMMRNKGISKYHFYNFIPKLKRQYNNDVNLGLIRVNVSK